MENKHSGVFRDHEVIKSSAGEPLSATVREELERSVEALVELVHACEPSPSAVALHDALQAFRAGLTR
jgi:hypothetical protein